MTALVVPTREEIAELSGVIRAPWWAEAAGSFLVVLAVLVFAVPMGGLR